MNKIVLKMLKSIEIDSNELKCIENGPECIVMDRNTLKWIGIHCNGPKNVVKDRSALLTSVLDCWL